MRLNNIQLLHFKKVLKNELSPNGKDISIYLRNGGGKSTWVDAYLWNLVGRDSRGQADFDIKTHGPDGVPIPDVDHEVILELTDKDGSVVTLRRNYHEVHAQKRGSASTTFTGHATDFWFNSTPVQKNDYEDRVADLVNLKLLRMLSDPMYFNSDEIKDSKTPAWQVRRRALIEMCGDVSDADVIKLNPELKDLPALMGKNTLDDFRKQLQGRRTEINQQIKTLPVRIDEATKSIPEVKHEVSYVESKIKEYVGVLQILQERRANLNAGGEVAEYTVKLREIEGKMLARINELKGSSGDARSAYQTKRSDLRMRLSEAEMERDGCKAGIKSIGQRLVEREQKRTSLRADWQTRKAETYPEFSGDGANCPTCGQPLPEDQIESARTKHGENRDAWNIAKSNDLARISQNGKSVAEDVGHLQSDLEQTRARLEASETECLTLTEQFEALQEPTDSKPDLISDVTYRDLVGQKLLIETTIDAARMGNSTAIDNLAIEIGQCEGRLKAAREAESNIKRKGEIEKRIDTLKADEKKLAEEFELSEGHLWLTDEFLRTKVSALTDRINSRFVLTKWRLFETQINGGLQEVCEATFNGTPWDSMSTSERINVGLDCINALSAAHGVSMPIWIDNCESVSHPIATIGQQIRLIVSEKDATMRVEDVDHEEDAAGFPKSKPTLPPRKRVFTATKPSEPSEAQRELSIQEKEDFLRNRTHPMAREMFGITDEDVAEARQNLGLPPESSVTTTPKKPFTPPKKGSITIVSQTDVVAEELPF